MRWCLLVAVFGCSSPGPSVAASAKSSACPAAWSDARAGACSGSASCWYPEGSCTCAIPPDCRGTPQAHPPPSTPRWVCTPHPGGGCPPTMPKQGERCDDGASCSYDIHCCSYSAECVGGAWSLGDKTCPG